MKDSPITTGQRPTVVQRLLESVAALVLLLVLFSLAWITLAAWKPESFQWEALELQVEVVLGLVSAALILVSLVALAHTGSKQ